MEHSKLPWKRCAVAGGWDGIKSADGEVLFNVVLNNDGNSNLLIEACNEHATLTAKTALFGELVDTAGTFLRLSKRGSLSPLATRGKLKALLARCKEAK